MKEVVIYVNSSGRVPFTDWLYDLRDVKTRRYIINRVRRFEQGIYGDCKPVGEGVKELRIFLGPGYRVYFGEDRDKIVVLLGGDKDSQDNDIRLAKAYWLNYKGCMEL